ncbi:hypothetical protein [Microvirga zambiensis]|uniref:hypothetical protein n=1 Tax=Microvirga zambiensis TaxID=1402137 RepID=UPI00192003BA|nr:hypothetical protein [Microvirga zambiensis]
MRSVVVLFGLMAMASVPAYAQDAREMPAPQLVQAPAHNPLDCYCRAQGKMVPEGEKTCLRTADGPRLAWCEMEVNVMSWTITETPCPDA